MANLGTEDRNKTAEAPEGSFGVEHLERLGNEEVLTKCCLESICCVLADAIPAVQIEGTDTTGARGRKVRMVQHRYHGNAYPNPATMDGIERVRAYPVTPPTIHRVPITNAGIAD